MATMTARKGWKLADCISNQEIIEGSKEDRGGCKYRAVSLYLFALWAWSAYKRKREKLRPGG